MGTPLFTGDVFQWARFCNDLEVQGSPWRPWNGVNEPEEIVTGAKNVLKKLRCCYRSYASSIGTVSLRTQKYFRSSLLSIPGISMERSDDLKYVCARRLGNSKDPQKRIGHGWDIKSHQQKGPNKTRNII